MTTRFIFFLRYSVKLKKTKSDFTDVKRTRSHRSVFHHIRLIASFQYLPRVILSLDQCNVGFSWYFPHPNGLVKPWRSYKLSISLRWTNCVRLWSTLNHERARGCHRHDPMHECIPSMPVKICGSLSLPCAGDDHHWRYLFLVRNQRDRSTTFSPLLSSDDEGRRDYCGCYRERMRMRRWKSARRSWEWFEESHAIEELEFAAVVPEVRMFIPSTTRSSTERQLGVQFTLNDAQNILHRFDLLFFPITNLNQPFLIFQHPKTFSVLQQIEHFVTKDLIECHEDFDRCAILR